MKKEIGLNLLEDMLTLYIRVRAHSYARDKQQLHKVSKNKTKNRSLRTEIKKQSSSLNTEGIECLSSNITLKVWSVVASFLNNNPTCVSN